MPRQLNLDTYGGRRWLTSVGIIVISTALLIFGAITATIWQEVVIYVFGIFAGANVLQRGVEATKEVKIAKQPTE
jgi:nitrate/nitrite transporter NarK